MPAIFNLDLSVLEFPSKKGSSACTVRIAVKGVRIFGGIGSGKTSGYRRMSALK